MRKGVFNLTRTGIEQGGGAQHRNQSPGGALVSPRVPTARNVYRSCCFMQPVRGIEGTRPSEMLWQLCPSTVHSRAAARSFCPSPRSSSLPSTRSAAQSTTVTTPMLLLQSHRCRVRSGRPSGPSSSLPPRSRKSLWADKVTPKNTKGEPSDGRLAFLRLQLFLM